MRTLPTRLLVSAALGAAATLAAAAAGLVADRPLHADPAPKVFFGNLHAHTKYSDGSGTPKAAYTMARNKAHLDFMAITEHNHLAAEDGAPADRRDGILIAKDHALYVGPAASALIPAATKANVDGTFVALYGQEFSTISKGNHVNVFDVNEVIDVASGDFKGLLTWLDAHPDTTGHRAILQLNHPADYDDTDAHDEYGRDDFGGEAAWLASMSGAAVLMEVVNGPGTKNGTDLSPNSSAEADYLDYLRLGFHVGPTGDQDNHYKTWGLLTRVRTGVIAPALTKAALLDALRARHVFATEDENLRVVFEVNGHLAGDRFAAPAPGSALDIRFTLHDDDEPDAAYRIDVLAGTIAGATATKIQAVNQSGDTPAGTWAAIDDVAYGGGFEYLLFRVVQKGGEDAPGARVWTAPVWLEPVTAPPVPAGGDVTKFVASKKSAIYHLSPECLDAKSIKAENKITGAAAMDGRTPHAGCPRK
jgi:hypothetical protein